MREIILDTETTGLDPRQGHRLVEIGALEMYNKVLTGKSFHYYINPERDVPHEAYQIHGISSAFLKDKPRFHEVSEELLKFLEGGKLVIHNASFDMNFLNFELSLINKATLDHLAVIDTLMMARKLFPGQKNNLDALCKRFKVDNSGRKYHGALLDASLLSEVYIELTGGRQTKLEINQLTNDLNQITLNNKNSYKDLNLKVIMPTDDELIHHNNFIAKLK